MPRQSGKPRRSRRAIADRVQHTTHCAHQRGFFFGFFFAHRCIRRLQLGLQQPDSDGDVAIYLLNERSLRRFECLYFAFGITGGADSVWTVIDAVRRSFFSSFFFPLDVHVGPRP